MFIEAQDRGPPHRLLREQALLAATIENGLAGLSILVLARKSSAQWVLEGDIRGCFDNISHAWMLDHIPADKDVLRKWPKAGFMENRRLFPTEAGTPQGGIISSYRDVFHTVITRKASDAVTNTNHTSGYGMCA